MVEIKGDLPFDIGFYELNSNHPQNGVVRNLTEKCEDCDYSLDTKRCYWGVAWATLNDERVSKDCRIIYEESPREVLFEGGSEEREVFVPKKVTPIVTGEKFESGKYIEYGFSKEGLRWDFRYFDAGSLADKKLEASVKGQMEKGGYDESSGTVRSSNGETLIDGLEDGEGEVFYVFGKLGKGVKERIYDNLGLEGKLLLRRAYILSEEFRRNLDGE